MRMITMVRVIMVCIIDILFKMSTVCIHAQYDSNVLAFDWIGKKRMTQYN